MNLNDLLPNGGIDALASQLGVAPEQAQRGAEALLPSVLGGMRDRSAGLDAHVDALGGASLAHNVMSDDPIEVDRGNQLLGGIFGTKNVSRQVAGHAAQGSGLESSDQSRGASDPRHAGRNVCELRVVAGSGVGVQLYSSSNEQAIGTGKRQDRRNVRIWVFSISSLRNSGKSVPAILPVELAKADQRWHVLVLTSSE